MPSGRDRIIIAWERGRLSARRIWKREHGSDVRFCQPSIERLFAFAVIEQHAGAVVPDEMAALYGLRIGGGSDEIAQCAFFGAYGTTAAEQRGQHKSRHSSESGHRLSLFQPQGPEDSCNSASVLYQRPIAVRVGASVIQEDA